MLLDTTITYSPEIVISIVGPSRSGTTAIKHALGLHPDICSLAGEEEPYYKMAHNGYPWHSSDEFYRINNPELVRILIANELHNYKARINRSYLQNMQLEEPPFVEVKECRVTPILLLKTPQNVYRKGVLDMLYPEAQIVYIKVHRDKCQIMNGLLDGWASKDFTARRTPKGWWKFDMPPGWAWADYVSMSYHQMSTAFKYMKTQYKDCMQLHFDELDDWKGMCERVWASIGLHIPAINDELPILSATDKDGPLRWKVKRPWLEQYIDSKNSSTSAKNNLKQETTTHTSPS